MKTLEFIYQENEIHFLVNPTDKNVMINATEMAKMFGKRTDHFLKTDHAKAFIDACNLPPNGGRLIENRGRNGVYFERRLALKFAAWLDPKFEVWVFSTIDEIVYGNYQKHWEAHAAQEKARLEMETLERKLKTSPDLETVNKYFDAVKSFKAPKAAKTWAIRNQLKLFVD